MIPSQCPVLKNAVNILEKQRSLQKNKEARLWRMNRKWSLEEVWAQYEMKKEVKCPGAYACLCWGFREVTVHRTNEGDFGNIEISLAHTWTDKQEGTYVVLK